MDERPGAGWHNSDVDDPGNKKEGDFTLSLSFSLAYFSATRVKLSSTRIVPAPFFLLFNLQCIKFLAILIPRASRGTSYLERLVPLRLYIYESCIQVDLYREFLGRT